MLLSVTLPGLFSTVCSPFYGNLVSSGWQFFCLELSACVVLGKPLIMRKVKKKKKTFSSICSHTQGAGTSLGAINSESTFQNAFRHGLFVQEKSYRNTSETSTPCLSVQCHWTFSLVLSPEGNNHRCTQKGQRFWKVGNSRWNANLSLKKKSLHWAIRHLEFDFVTQERNFPAG